MPCNLPPTDTIDATPILFAQPNIAAIPPGEEELWDFPLSIDQPQSNLIVNDDSNPSTANIFEFRHLQTSMMV